ncbi:MAG: hypothetical protein KUG81_03590 [Gammaproteobacteria bacterium]|nr:hypothetical protein [Gammaproteobacteria bacterium]
MEFRFAVGQKVFVLTQPAEQERVEYVVETQATDTTGQLYLCQRWTKDGDFKQAWFRVAELGAAGPAKVTKQLGLDL